MVILFFLISFFIEAAQESLYHLNTLLEQHAYKKVLFTGVVDVDLQVENHSKMLTLKPQRMNASDKLAIWYNSRWHTQPFIVPEGEHVIKMRWTIKVCSDKPVPVAYLRKILQGKFYYAARQELGENVLHVSVHQHPLSQFLMIEPFDIVGASGHACSLPPYIKYFKSSFDIDYNAVQKSYNQLLERCASMPYDASFQIPLTMHTVWITDPLRPKSPKDECFDMHKKTMGVCSYGWQQIFWVHNKNDNPTLSASLKNCPEKNQEIDVRELSELFNDPRLVSLKPYYEYALWIKNYGRASDIARIAILYVMGGVYRDTDFQFLQDPKKLNQTCSFYAGFEDSYHTHLNNAMIASAPFHPILTEMMRLIENPHPIPENMKNPVHATLFETGPFALTRAVFATDLGNVGLLPYPVFYSPFVERGYMPGIQLGMHGHFKEWVGR